VKVPPGSFSGFRQPRLSPASPGDALSGARSSASSSHSRPLGHEVVGRRHRALVEHVEVEVDPEGPAVGAQPVCGPRARGAQAPRAQLVGAEDLQGSERPRAQVGDVGGLLRVARAEHDDVRERRARTPGRVDPGVRAAPRRRRSSACRRLRRWGTSSRRTRRRGRRRRPPRALRRRRADPPARPAPARSSRRAPAVARRPPRRRARPRAPPSSSSACPRCRSRRWPDRARHRGSARRGRLGPGRQAAPAGRARTAAGACSVPPARPTESIGTPIADQGADTRGG
jgi:hypothetical protein